jgi:hypothetical protein
MTTLGSVDDVDGKPRRLGGTRDFGVDCRQARRTDDQALAL